MSTDKKTIDGYNEHASEYDEHFDNPKDNIYHRLYEKPAMRDALPNLRGKKVLSIGCGSGHDVAWLANKGAQQAVGIDISSGMIDIAKTRYPALEFSVMDMEQLKFPSESFDLLYSSLAIHYVKDWTKALTEAHRVLRPGGQYVFSCAHPLDSSFERDDNKEAYWRLFGKTVNKASGVPVFHGNYLNVEQGGTKQFEAKLGESLEVTWYQKTFSNMANEIISSGLTIQKVIEPVPLPEMKAIDSNNFEQLSRSPAFIIWSLQK